MAADESAREDFVTEYEREVRAIRELTQPDPEDRALVRHVENTLENSDVTLTEGVFCTDEDLVELGVASEEQAHRLPALGDVTESEPGSIIVLQSSSEESRFTLNDTNGAFPWSPENYYEADSPRDVAEISAELWAQAVDVINRRDERLEEISEPFAHDMRYKEYLQFLPEPLIERSGIRDFLEGLERFARARTVGETELTERDARVEMYGMLDRGLDPDDLKWLALFVPEGYSDRILGEDFEGVYEGGEGYSLSDFPDSWTRGELVETPFYQDV